MGRKPKLSAVARLQLDPTPPGDPRAGQGCLGCGLSRGTGKHHQALGWCRLPAATLQSCLGSGIFMPQWWEGSDLQRGHLVLQGSRLETGLWQLLRGRRGCKRQGGPISSRSRLTSQAPFLGFLMQPQPPPPLQRRSVALLQLSYLSTETEPRVLLLQGVCLDASCLLWLVLPL